MRKLVIGLAAVLLLTGCSSGSDEPPKAEPTKDAVRKIDPAKAATMTLGDDLKVVADLPQKLGEQETFFRGFTSDGKLVGSVTPPDKPPTDGIVGGPLTTQARPVLYDPETKKFTVLDSRKREQNTQLPVIVSSGDFVVWLETPESTASTARIAIYSYDRRSKNVAQLYSTDDPDGTMNGGDDLVVKGDQAYFSRFACCQKRDRRNATVYSVPVDGSAPATALVKGGRFVTLAGEALMYELKGKMFTRDLPTGITKPLAISPQVVKDPGFCGAEFTEAFDTLCMGKPGGDQPGDVVDPVLTIKERSGRTTRLAPFPTESLSYPVPHDVIPIGSWVGVTMSAESGADREFLVDLESQSVKAFPKSTSFGELNADGSQALLSIPKGAKKWPQVIVQIPPVS